MENEPKLVQLNVNCIHDISDECRICEIHGRMYRCKEGCKEFEKIKTQEYSSKK